MWSKTLKGLNDRLAPSLKDRVKYHCEDKRGYNECWALQFVILVNGEQWSVQNNSRFWSKGFKEIREIDPHWEQNSVKKYGDSPRYATEAYITEKTGYTFFDYVFRDIHEYLNEVNMKKDFKKIVEDRKYFLILFGILDRRVGKRTFEWIYDNLDKFPDWLHRFIKLRVECEGWSLKGEQI